MSGPGDLATHRHCLERLHAEWAGFAGRRRDRLGHGAVVERVAEAMLEDLFTHVLDWPLGQVRFQEERADLVLTHMGIKYLILEAKRPGALAWNRRAVDAALEQALRYADEQKVPRIAVSDGTMLYAADVAAGGLRDRVFVSLADVSPPESLWWLSLHGIYRTRDDIADAVLRLLPEAPIEAPSTSVDDDAAVLHPKYHLPARCFAFVGHAADAATWKLPYLRIDGTVDSARLPKAIGAILRNYRGVRVSGIPDDAIADVLVRLARAAHRMGKLPAGANGGVYADLQSALDQLGRMAEVDGQPPH